MLFCLNVQLLLITQYIKNIKEEKRPKMLLIKSSKSSEDSYKRNFVELAKKCCEGKEH